MNTVTLKINGVEVQAPEGSTILEAARIAGIEIPTLCYLKEVNEIGACRICVVEVKGARSLVASCVYPINEGMEVFTNTPKVLQSRRMTLELILSNHRMHCLTCKRNQNCELQKLARDFGIDAVRYGDKNMKPDIEDSAAHLVRDNSKCILCRRCVNMCGKIQAAGVIGPSERGFATHICSPFEKPLNNVPCVSCGQCIVVCPTGALTEKDDTQKVWDALSDPSKHVVIAPAPSIRVTLGECFGMPVGTNVEGKMVAAMRRLGFDKVFDVDTAADLTIMEEGTEFIERLSGKGPLPLITSCSPGWIRFCEQFFPDFIPNLSSCKSPQQMYGAMTKTYYAEKAGIDPKDIVTVSVMPCTAKKFEIGREDQSAAGVPDVDIALTTREFADMVKTAGIMFDKLPDEEFDPAFGVSTGASVIFGTTGGVMEAALRTVVEKVSGKELDSVDFTAVRGLEGIKEAELEVAGKKVRAAIASGLANCKALLKKIQAGEAEYDFIEMMACPGGCINGGGQPIHDGATRSFTDLRSMRAKALYDQDKDMPMRKSHENPVIKTIYDEYLGAPGAHKAHEILHTSYQAREKYPVED